MPKVFIIFGLGILFIILAIAVPMLIAKSMKTSSVVKSDEAAAVARVIEIVDTGGRYNRNPVVKLKLEVTPPGAHPYRVDVKTVISVVDVPAFQPGCVIRVKYKKDNLSDVAVIGK
jgi:hypothetical protein